MDKTLTQKRIKQATKAALENRVVPEKYKIRGNPLQRANDAQNFIPLLQKMSKRNRGKALEKVKSFNK